MTAVPRPKTVLTNEQQRLLNRAVELSRAADDAEDAAWAAIKAARDAGVGDILLCEETGRSRATLNRRYGPRS